jgi:hypothetical protein
MLRTLIRTLLAGAVGLGLAVTAGGVAAVAAPVHPDTVVTVGFDCADTVLNLSPTGSGVAATSMPLVFGPATDCYQEEGISAGDGLAYYCYYDAPHDARWTYLQDTSHGVSGWVPSARLSGNATSACPLPTITCTANPSCATPPTSCGTLTATQGFYRGQSLTSCDGRFQLLTQVDGNLVLYFGASALWSSKSAVSNGDELVMQADGNLVLYGDSGVRWASNTSGKGSAPYHMSLQNDGNLVVYSGTGAALWSSKTCCH